MSIRWVRTRNLHPLTVLLSAGLLVGCATEPTDITEQGGATRPHFSRVTAGEFVTDGASSPSASWSDIDEDGDDDLYVLNGYGSLENDPVPQANKLYRNDGNGVLTPVDRHPLVDDTTFSGSSTWGDYDNDGDLDLFVANQRNADNFLFRNDGDGAFFRITRGAIVNDGGRSFSAVWVDVNDDGWIDLHVLNGRDGSEGQVDFMYRNLGTGRFARVDSVAFATEALPSGGAAWGDFDGDGDADLFLPVYSTSEANRLYRNDGGWRFTEITREAGLTDDLLPYSPSSSVAHWLDFDGDLDLDLFVGNTGGTIDYLFENDGTGHFEKIRAGRIGLDATYVSDAIWGDFDNDADQDLILAVWGGASEFFENSGAGRFYPSTAGPASAGDFGRAVTFASSASANDYDDDGDLDVYLTQWPINEEGGGPNLFYVNDTREGNWIKVDLEGTDSNRSAIGAKIIVTATIDDRRRSQLRYVSARTSWRSTGNLTQHFGLADAREIASLEVRWPSGRVDTTSGPIPVNQRLRIVEGRGIVRRGL